MSQGGSRSDEQVRARAGRGLGAVRRARPPAAVRGRRSSRASRPSSRGPPWRLRNEKCLRVEGEALKCGGGAIEMRCPERSRLDNAPPRSPAFLYHRLSQPLARGHLDRTMQPPTSESTARPPWNWPSCAGALAPGQPWPGAPPKHLVDEAEAWFQNKRRRVLTMPPPLPTLVGAEPRPSSPPVPAFSSLDATALARTDSAIPQADLAAPPLAASDMPPAPTAAADGQSPPLITAPTADMAADLMGKDLR